MILSRQIKNIIILPFSFTVLVPAILLAVTESNNPGMGYEMPIMLIIILIGLFFASIGMGLIYQTIMLFDKYGRGTLAPWNPPKKLVISGLYQYVRNPMISGAFCILIAEALIYGSWILFIWTALFILVNVIYIPFFEEPALRKRFGKSYTEYAYHVPRWIPRAEAWQPEGWEEKVVIKNNHH